MQLHFIANASVASTSGRTIPVIDPSDGQPFDEIQRGTADDIDAAVGKTLDEINLAKLNVEVNAVRRHNVRGNQPAGNMIMKAGDVLVLLGQPRPLAAAKKHLREG